MINFHVGPAWITFGLIAILLVNPVDGGDPLIVIDNRPESGIPPEAIAQEKSTAPRGLPLKFNTLTAGSIKSIRIRYYNKDTWANEKDAIEYVSGFLKNKASEVFDFQVWSQGVGVPEIECYVVFTDETRKKLLAEKKDCRDGRLLIWNTESCFRDGTGRWYFVSAFDHFHRAHPQGDRKLAK